MTPHIKLFNSELDAEGFVIPSYEVPWVGYIKDIYKVLWASKRSRIENGMVVRPSNEIYYTSSDLKKISIYNEGGLGTVVNLSYEDIGIIELADSVTLIGTSSFYNTTKLTSINIPNSVTLIGELAFRDCTMLYAASLGKSILAIDADAFSGCISLVEIFLPNSVQNLGSRVFKDCSSIVSIKIPKGISIIPSGAFLNCYKLLNIILHDGIKAINNGAFLYCRELKLIQLPSLLETLGSEVFVGCSKLEEIVIPDSVLSIGNYAFKDTVLSSVTCMAIVPPTLGVYNFNKTSVIYVPSGSVDAYKAAWSGLADKIQPIIE